MTDSTSPPWAGMPAAGPLLRVDEAARYVGYSKTRYYALAAVGEVPRPIKMGRGHGGAAGVPRPWLDALIADWVARAGVAA